MVRKRVSLAEMILGLPSIGCWDNSTRGLDATTALDFIRSLRMTASLIGMTHVVAMYQASESIFKLFDKVMVLYEGEEVFFGPREAAKSYFRKMGWYCHERQTTPDFLTSVTDPQTRQPLIDFESRVPRTSKEFRDYWLTSPEYKALVEEQQSREGEIKESHAADIFQRARRAAKSTYLRRSPYTVNACLQLKVCLNRSWLRIWTDKAPTVTALLGQIFMSLVVGSVFYGSPETTAGLFSTTSAIFFAILLSALIALTEINTLYSGRPVVEKQSSYA
jgi:energy-coupling factor transporter ATP-binding protein EcfA2